MQPGPGDAPARLHRATTTSEVVVPPDLRDLEDLDPFELLDIESARIAMLLSSLPESGWSQRTRCEEWTVRDLLAHLATLEEYRRACLGDTVGELCRRARSAGVTDKDSFNAWGVALRAEVAPADLLDQWRQDSAENRRRLKWRGPYDLVSTAFGWYPVRLFCFYLAAEYATHADDMGAPVGPDELAERSGWRARFTQVALAESGRPVDVARVPAGYRIRAWGEQMTLSVPDFVEAGTRRLGSHRISPRLRELLACLA